MLKFLLDFKLCRSYFISYSTTFEKCQKGRKIENPKKDVLFWLVPPTGIKGPFVRAKRSGDRKYL
jgi:hypothetical protein